MCTASVVALVLLVLTSTTPSAARDPRAKIKAASGLLLGPPNPSVTQPAIVNAMLDLLDVAASLTRESQYGQEIKYHIDVAKDLFLKTSLFNEKARQYLSFAHRMMSGGKKYEKPEGLDEFVTPEELQEKSRKYCATLVNGALAALERGHKVEAATLLLEVVLAIVTPVSSAPTPAPKTSRFSLGGLIEGFHSGTSSHRGMESPAWRRCSSSRRIRPRLPVSRADRPPAA